jgi:hypothetical protein
MIRRERPSTTTPEPLVTTQSLIRPSSRDLINTLVVFLTQRWATRAVAGAPGARRAVPDGVR